MSRIGFTDKRIHPSLKCYIKQGDTEVVVAVKEGYTFAVGTEWESPFGGDTAGEKAGQAAKLIQHKTGWTSITQLNSALTWRGNEPLNITFTGVLKALSKDTVYDDVQKAYAAIMSMGSPNVQGWNPVSGVFGGKGGKRPSPIDMTILNNLNLTGCVLKAFPVEVRGTNHHKSGLPMSAEIQFEVSTIMMLNSSEFANLFKK